AAGLPIAAEARESQRFIKIKKAKIEAPDANGAAANSMPVPEILQRFSQEAISMEPKRGTYPHGEDEPAGAKQAGEFIYKSADGTEALKVRKVEVFDSSGARVDKRYPQAWMVNGRWVSKKPEGWVPIPYRLPELLAAPADATIDIFEGEKDAD